MATTQDRRSWFGLGVRPRLDAEIFPQRRRLKSLDEFEPPEFLGRMERVERKRGLGRWVLLIAGFGVGVAIGLRLIGAV